MMRLILGLWVALALGGCAVYGGGRDIPAGWYRPYDSPKLAERHCYRTLARADCHSRPLADEEHRRMGFFDTPVSK